jgi:hypothetical protein
MAGMHAKEIRALVRECEAQGCQSETTRKGIRLLLPDGTSTQLHWTGSDYRDRLNIHARLRRAGVDVGRSYTSPKERITMAAATNTTEDTSLYSTKKPYATSIAKVQAVLEDLGSPIDIRPADIREVTGQGWQVIYGCLYALGYRRSETTAGPTRGYLWSIPEPITHPEIAAARALPAPVPAITPETVTRSDPKPPAGREFLDSADSWTVDVASVASVPISALVTTYRAAGLECELRVWRVDS